MCACGVRKQSIKLDCDICSLLAEYVRNNVLEIQKKKKKVDSLLRILYKQLVIDLENAEMILQIFYIFSLGFH